MHRHTLSGNGSQNPGGYDNACRHTPHVGRSSSHFTKRESIRLFFEQVGRIGRLTFATLQSGDDRSQSTRNIPRPVGWICAHSTCPTQTVMVCSRRERDEIENNSLPTTGPGSRRQTNTSRYSQVRCVDVGAEAGACRGRDVVLGRNDR